MDLDEIREMADQPNANPATVQEACIHRLVLRPADMAEHAELLYLYAETHRRLHQQQALLVAEYARRARQFALDANSPFTALRAGCLALSEEANAKTLTKEVFERELASLQTEYEVAVKQGKLTGPQSACMKGCLTAMDLNASRLEQNDDFLTS